MTLIRASTCRPAKSRRDTMRHIDGDGRTLTPRPTRPTPHRVSQVLDVRAVELTDGQLLADILAGLSPQSRLARFLAPKHRLSAAEVRYLTEIDHHNHEALIAITLPLGEPVGVARFIRDREDPTSAEVAIAVVDEWQNRGVGSLLASRLAARARREGISYATALMSADNHRSRRLLEQVGALTQIEREGGTVSYRVALPLSAPATRQPDDVPRCAAGCE